MSLVFFLGAVSLVTYAWLALAVYRFQRDPAVATARQGAHEWILGPSASSLSRTAHERLVEGLRVLNDPVGSPAERIEAYQNHLEAAERLLVRSVRAQPVQPKALAQLAAIRWELDPPVTEQAIQNHLDLIDLASRLSPQSPGVHKDLGELLLRMGRRREAIDFLRRTVELKPAESAEVVEILIEHLFPVDEILATMPNLPELTVALQRPFFEEGRETAYADLLEEAVAVAPGSAALVRAYGNTCLRVRDPERILRFLATLAPTDDTEVEVERLIQSSRARIDLGQSEQAMQDAERALSLLPHDPRLHEHLGAIALAAGDEESAIAAFRQALGQVARQSGNPIRRARLYRRIGQALEQQENGHLAYDAYRKALTLNPEEPIASRRVAEMEEAAGVRGR